MRVRIGFTGTRYGMTDYQKESFREFLQVMEDKMLAFHHGGCIGADTEASIIADELGEVIVCHPPVDTTHVGEYKAHTVLDPKSHLARNRDIVNATDILVACPNTAHELPRGGTWYTVRYARKQHKPILLITPEGGK